MSILVAMCFMVTGLNLPAAQAQELVLPEPGVMVHVSPAFNPPVLKGIKVHTDDPFKFDFILDQGDSLPLAGRAREGEEQLKEESTKLIKYFLASLTIPEKDLWVNLSPYEKNRVIPESFGQTEMGRDLLAEDYMLKQITASLIYPEEQVGQKFWKRIYAEAAKKFGTTNIPVNTFNKVWIIPEKAVVYENAQAGTAYVVESKLKVMLEQDYLALSHAVIPVSSSVIPAKAGIQDSSAIGSQIVREIVIPELTKEVNQGQNFAQLRQVYQSFILAAWYKKKIKDSILAQVYADKNKIQGLSSPKDSVGDPDTIYQRYVQAFKKGVYNYIKEETDPVSNEMIPRKYFSGGVNFSEEQFGKGLSPAMIVTSDRAMLPNTKGLNPNMLLLGVSLHAATSTKGVSSPAMSIPEVIALMQQRLSLTEYNGLITQLEAQGLTMPYMLKEYDPVYGIYIMNDADVAKFEKAIKGAVRAFNLAGFIFMRRSDYGGLRQNAPEVRIIYRHEKRHNDYGAKHGYVPTPEQHVLEELYTNFTSFADVFGIHQFNVPMPTIRYGTQDRFKVVELKMVRVFPQRAKEIRISIEVLKKYLNRKDPLLTQMIFDYLLECGTFSELWGAVDATESQAIQSRIHIRISDPNHIGRYIRFKIFAGKYVTAKAPARYREIMGSLAMNAHPERILVNPTTLEEMSQLILDKFTIDRAEGKYLASRFNKEGITQGLDAEGNTIFRTISGLKLVEISPLGTRRFFNTYNRWVLSVDVGGRTTHQFKWSDMNDECYLARFLNYDGSKLELRNVGVGSSELVYEETGERIMDIGSSLEFLVKAGAVPTANIEKLLTGAGTALFNLVARLAKDQNNPLVFKGIITDKTLYRSLLEVSRPKNRGLTEKTFLLNSSFYDWDPVPNENIFNATGAFVSVSPQTREMKRAYYGSNYYFPLHMDVATAVLQRKTGIVQEGEQYFLMKRGKIEAIIDVYGSKDSAMHPSSKADGKLGDEFVKQLGDVWLDDKALIDIEGASYVWDMGLDQKIVRIGPLLFPVLIDVEKGLRARLEHKPTIPDDKLLDMMDAQMTKLKTMLGPLYEDHKNKVVFIPPLVQESAYMPLNQYTTSSIAGMLRYAGQIRSKTFVDLGAGSGILSLVALALGASNVVLVESDEFNIELAEHLLNAHGYKKNEKYFIVKQDLAQGDLIEQEIKQVQPDAQRIAVGINIGPWPFYGNAMQLAHDIVKKMVPAFVLYGGFNISADPKYNYQQVALQHVIDILRPLGAYDVRQYKPIREMSTNEQFSATILVAQSSKAMTIRQTNRERWVLLKRYIFNKKNPNNPYRVGRRSQEGHNVYAVLYGVWSFLDDRRNWDISDENIEKVVDAIAARVYGFPKQKKRYEKFRNERPRERVKIFNHLRGAFGKDYAINYSFKPKPVVTSILAPSTQTPPTPPAVAKTLNGAASFNSRLEFRNLGRKLKNLDPIKVLSSGQLTLGLGDAAMPTNGGIDLTSDKALQVKNNGAAIKFHIDPAMLAQLQNARGFVSTIDTIHPMTDINIFLGLNEQDKVSL